MPAPRPAPPSRVLIGYNIHSELADYLRARRDDLDIRSKRFVEVTPADVQWAEAYVGFRRPPIDDWGSVRWVHCTGAGVDAYLFRDPIPDHVLLTRTNEPFGPQIAEWCVSRALAETQHLFALRDAQREHRWAPCFISTLAGTPVLIVGTGEVGTAVGRAFAALGCPVDGVSRSGAARPGFRSVRPIGELADAVGEARWIVLAVPLTEDTVHLVDRRVLEQCRGAYLFNVGRGALADEQALPDALDRGWLRGVALDVFEVEPLPPQSPLWDRPDVVIAPHVAGLTTTAGAGDGFLASLAALERGEMPPMTVDREKGY